MSHSESITVEQDGLYYVIPTKVRGRKLTDKEAIDYAFTHRQWQGVFKNQLRADAFARRRSRLSPNVPSLGKVSH